MNQKPRSAVTILLILLLLFTAGVAVLAQTSQDYNLEWHVIAGGGGQSASAAYRVNGTIGQSLASPPLSGGGAYTLSSGYWYAPSTVYLPLVIRN